MPRSAPIGVTCTLTTTLRDQGADGCTTMRCRGERALRAEVVCDAAFRTQRVSERTAFRNRSGGPVGAVRLGLPNFGRNIGRSSGLATIWRYLFSCHFVILEIHWIHLPPPWIQRTMRQSVCLRPLWIHSLYLALLFLCLIVRAPSSRYLLAYRNSMRTVSSVLQ